MNSYPSPRRADADRPAGCPSRLPLWILYGGAALVFLLDQTTKLLVIFTLAHGREVAVLGRVLSFTRHHNTGGAFGLFASGTTALTVVSILVIVILVLFGRRAALTSRCLGLGIALQLGGAAGNLLDRARLGHVIDFIDFHFWPVFNIADIGVTVGAFLIVYALLFDPALRGTAN